MDFVNITARSRFLNQAKKKKIKTYSLEVGNIKISLNGEALFVLPRGTLGSLDLRRTAGRS